MTEQNGHRDESVSTDEPKWQHYDVARKALQSGDAATAVSACKQALEDDPGFSPALELAGVIACQQQDFPTGIAYFSQLTESEPDSPTAWFNLGNAYANSGQLEQAVPALEKSIELKPEHHKSAVVLSQSLYGMGEHEAAIDRLETVVHQDPDNVMALNSLATLLARHENFEAALPHIRHAAELQPKVPQLQSNLGMILFRSGMVNEAKDAFLSALSVDHNDIESRFGLGSIAHLQRHYEEASSHFRKILKRAPGHSSAMLNLIDCLKASNNNAEAEQWLNQGRQQWPDDDRFAGD